MKTFENKTVLITGGASGIGKATAIAFGKEGANVVVSGRRVAEGEQVAREITSSGGSAVYVQAERRPGGLTLSRSSKKPSAPSGRCTSRSTTPAPRASSACSSREQTVESTDDQVCDAQHLGGVSPSTGST